MAFTLHIHFHLQHQEGLWKVCSVKDRNIRFAGIHFRFLSQGDVITSVKRLKTDQPSANVMSKVSPNMPTSDIRSFHNIFPKSSHVPNCFQNQVVYRAPFKRFDLFLHIFSISLCFVFFSTGQTCNQSCLPRPWVAWKFRVPKRFANSRGPPAVRAGMDTVNIAFLGTNISLGCPPSQ